MSTCGLIAAKDFKVWVWSEPSAHNIGLFFIRYNQHSAECSIHLGVISNNTMKKDGGFNSS